jgi:hypothetical protein
MADGEASSRAVFEVRRRARATDDVAVAVELPPAVAALLGERDEAAACAARQAAILHLLRAGALSQGWAAPLLGVTRHDIIDLMADQDIPSGPLTIEEYRREVERASRLLSDRRT